MGKKIRKRIPPKKITGYVEPTDSEPKIHPDATLSPDASTDSATTLSILQRESTSAPNIGEEEKENYAETVAGLADKHLFSKKFIPFSIILIICAIVASILFVQDNQAGLLTDIKSVYWTLNAYSAQSEQ
jgi:hypothetical protein